MRWVLAVALVAGLYGEVPPETSAATSQLDGVKIHYNRPGELSPEQAREIGKLLKGVWETIPTRAGEFVVLDLEYKNGTLNGKVVESNLPPDRLKELIGKLKGVKFPAPFQIRVKFKGEDRVDPLLELTKEVEQIWKGVQVAEGEVELQFLPTGPKTPPKIKVVKNSIPVKLLKELIGKLEKAKLPPINEPVKLLLFRVDKKGELKILDQSPEKGGTPSLVEGNSTGTPPKAQPPVPKMGLTGAATSEKPALTPKPDLEKGTATPKPQPAHPNPKPEPNPPAPHPAPNQFQSNPPQLHPPSPTPQPAPKREAAPPPPKPPKPPTPQPPGKDKNKEVEKILAKFRELDRKVEELLHYNFKLENFDRMETPFWRPPKKVDTEIKKEPTISYRYEVLAILNDSVRLRVVKFKGDQVVSTVEDWFQPGAEVGGCKIGKIDFDNSQVVLICGNKRVVKTLLPEQIQIKVK